MRFYMLRLVPLVVLASSGWYLLAAPNRDNPQEVATPAEAVWFIADTDLEDKFVEKLGDLVKAEKCLSGKKLKSLVEQDRKTKLDLPKAPTKPTTPEAIYDQLLQSVVIVGSVILDDDGDPQGGAMATAWALGNDGLFVTNWHLFDGVKKDEHFGVMTAKKEVYPLIDVIAVNKSADICIFKVAGKGFKGLTLANQPGRVGSWVGVLGHPGGMHFTFTTGAISRYTEHKPEDKDLERWMTITAEYAFGSSGSPVVNSSGAVVGMAAMTEAIDYPEEEPKDKDEARVDAARKGRHLRKPIPVRRDDEKEKPPVKGSPLQMVVKTTVPVTEILSLVSGGMP